MKVLSLIEAVALSKARQYRQNWDETRYQDLFATLAQTYKASKNNYRIYIPLKSPTPFVQPNNQILKYLYAQDIQIDDYLKGTGTDKYGRSVRLGRALAKSPEMKSLFDNDPGRKGANQSNYVMVLSRHPYDVIGMSTDRGWTSCMNLIDGANRKYVMSDVQNGTMVVYFTTTNDMNLNRPSGRALLKPFINVSDPKDMLVMSDQIYGTIPVYAEDGLKSLVKKINKLLGHSDTGIFCLPSDSYADQIDRTTILNRNNLDQSKFLKSPKAAYMYALHKLDNRFPEAEDIIATSPEWAFEYAINILHSKRWEKAEPAISTDPKLAVDYAALAIHGRFPEAESVIAKDPRSAFLYADNIIKGRWPEGEAAIATEPEWAYRYAFEIIRGPWSEGEAAIAKNPEQSYQYAYYIIRDKWPKGEAAIAKDPDWAILYARKVIKGRWPEGEATIAKKPWIALSYATNVIKGRWPEGEAAIATNGRCSYDYARIVLESRFPEGEEAISKEDYLWDSYQEIFGKTE